MSPIVGLAGVVVLGVAAQWVAWRLRLPSILLLLLTGFAAGNLIGIDPDELLGDLLFPIVSLSVAVILFEGGLTLRFSELPHVGKTVLKLISVGVLITAFIATLAAHYLVGLSWEIAALVGSILTVTGPTVVGPLLRHVRPSGTVGAVLNWEGILVDPVGAVLAVLVFQAVSDGSLREAPLMVLLGVGKVLLVGAAIGAATALAMVQVLRRFWIPDHLQSPFALAMVLGAAVLSDRIHHESSLLTVTLMGIGLANQKGFAVRHIVEFKENLRVLLISSLFILLAARVRYEQLEGLTLGSFGFVAVLILVARPLSVLASTWGSDIPVRARLFLAWMAPRGIVAASVTALFALGLHDRTPEAARLVPLVFLVIVGTVSVYGLTAGPLARRLGLAEKDPQGVLILGIHPFSLELGKVLRSLDFTVLMVDSNYRKVSKARMENLPVWHGNILTDYAIEEMRLGGLGRFLALTPNDEANALAAQHLRDVFTRTGVYQLQPQSRSGGARDPGVSKDMGGRFLFDEGLTQDVLIDRVLRGWVIKTTPLTEKFDYEQYRAQYGGDAVPLFLLTQDSRALIPFTTSDPPEPIEGQTIIGLVPPTSSAPTP